jgi:hypothetical protein
LGSRDPRADAMNGGLLASLLGGIVTIVIAAIFISRRPKP